MYKLAQKTFEGNTLLQSEANALLEQVMQGNMSPGRGTGYSPVAKDIFELRGFSQGARIYFRNVKEGIEIVGYSHNKNQEDVIKLLINKYGQIKENA